jgi:hypothetical protein
MTCFIHKNPILFEANADLKAMFEEMLCSAPCEGYVLNQLDMMVNLKIGLLTVPTPPTGLASVGKDMATHHQTKRLGMNGSHAIQWAVLP